MADIKISALPAGTPTPTSLVPAVNGVTTERVTVASILALATQPAGFFSQATAPTAKQPGDMWLNGEVLSLWDGATWVEVSAAGAVVSEPVPPPGTAPGDLWIKPSGSSTGGPAVYEQDSAPPTAETGDLWLASLGVTIGGSGTAVGGTGAGGTIDDGYRLTIADVDREIESIITDPSNGALKELKDTIIAAVLFKLNGGSYKSPDYEWQATTQVAGAGNVEASIRGGRLYLRGAVTITTSRWTHVRTLPAGFPKPLEDSYAVVAAAESGVAERLALLFVNKDGTIHVSPMGNRITDFRTDGFNCRVP